MWCLCDVELVGGGRIVDARTFRWDSDLESRWLEDGIFDLDRRKSDFKLDIVGKADTSN
jgi:hypothetical protein